MHGLTEFTLQFADSAAFARMWLTELARGRLFVATHTPPKLGGLATLRVVIQTDDPEQPLVVKFTVAVLSRRNTTHRMTGGFGCELEAVPTWEQPKLEAALAAGVKKQDEQAAFVVPTDEITLDDLRRDERREHQRVHFSRPVIVNMGTGRTTAQGVDLSEGGLGIRSNSALYTGNDVAIQLDLPDGGPAIITLARANWAVTNGPFVNAGLQFQNPTRIVQERIRSCIRGTSIYDPPR